MQTLASIQMMYDVKNYITKTLYNYFIFLKTQAFVCYMVGPSGIYKYMTKKNNDLEPILSDDAKRLTIPYQKNNQFYSITVPYDLMTILPMKDLEATLHKGDIHIPITQQPGIPYISSATDLGGDSISIRNKVSGKSETFPYNNVPGSCYSLYDNE